MDTRCNGWKVGAPTTPSDRQKRLDTWILVFEFFNGSEATLLTVNCELCVCFLI
jgi:hypothetical protein